jgi:V8-like Glu-specific endopeptidase
MRCVRVATVALIAVGACSSVQSAFAAVPVRWSARAARAFWTPERMRRATPLEVSARGARDGTLTGSRSGHPSASHLIPPLASAGASSSSSFDQVSDPTEPGYRVNGVIFFSTFFGLARCSGTSVRAANLSVVLTAAHCVREGGRHGSWNRRGWVFVPGYRYGQRPFGVFAAKWLDTTLLWQTAGSPNADVGAAVVRRNEHGERLAKAVGGDGIAWGLKASQVFDVHGYPVGRPFDGETQRLCAQTPFLGHSPESFYFAGPLDLAVSCNVTGGASGGGWTIRNGVLNSVTSSGYLDDPATDYGPYFGREVARLYRRAARVR